MHDRSGMKVYALIDPRDPLAAEYVRYVGCSANPKLRLRRHIWETRHPNVLMNIPKFFFILYCLLDGVLPRMLVLEEVFPGRDPLVREQYWIQFFREHGGNLTNFQRPAPAPVPEGEPHFTRALNGARWW